MYSACLNGHTSCVRRLLEESGQNDNNEQLNTRIQTNDGWTPINIGNYEITFWVICFLINFT